LGERSLCRQLIVRDHDDRVKVIRVQVVAPEQSMRKFTLQGRETKLVVAIMA
jgi:hypothetical protein